MGAVVRVIAVVASLAAFALAGGVAAAADVSLRVEGGSATLMEKRVETTVHPVDGGDGTGPHPCSGGLGTEPGPTATGALDDGLRGSGVTWSGSWDPSFYDFFVDRIGAEANQPPDGYWALWINGRPAAGGCSTKVRDGDEVLWSYGSTKTSALALSGPGTVEAGTPFEVSVSDRNGPVAGASVGGATTGADGSASLQAGEAGRLDLKAEKDGAVRSNLLTVCVGGATGCEPTVPAPSLRIDKIEPGQRFARGAGPRVLRGEARSAGSVELALTGRAKGRCVGWLADAQRLGRERCGSRRWFPATVEGDLWLARIGRLPAGRYVLHSRVRSADLAARARFRILQRRGSRARLNGGALAYLRRAAGEGGAYGIAPGAPLSAAMTDWVAFALGVHRIGGRRAVAAKAARLGGARRGGDLARGAAALTFADPGSRAAARSLARLRRQQRPDGSVAADVNATALAALALCRERAGRAGRRAITWLETVQAADGGFGFQPGVQPDVDTTGTALWAAGECAPGSDMVPRAEAFLVAAQGDDGGFPSTPGGDSNSQSTGLALAGLDAVGRGPRALATEDGIDPIDFLTTLQRRSGAISYSSRGRQTPVWTTSQALLGTG